MADEGGASGAVMEGEDADDILRDPTAHRPFPLVKRLDRKLSIAAMRTVGTVAMSGVAIALIGLAIRR